MNGSTRFLGTVHDGKLQVLLPEDSRGIEVRLTRIAVMEVIPPEAREVNLTEYENTAIMVHGLLMGEWICRAEVIDAAGPILTAVVQQVFG